jgi:hypothetical protein
LESDKAAEFVAVVAVALVAPLPVAVEEFVVVVATRSQDGHMVRVVAGSCM